MSPEFTFYQKREPTRLRRLQQEENEAEVIMREYVMSQVELALEKDPRNRPFVALALGPNKEIYIEHNQTGTGDPTAHAEIKLIGSLCKRLGTTDLSGYTIYTNVEPCIGCMACILRAEADKLVYGADMEPHAVLPIASAQMVKDTNSKLVIVNGVLGEETQAQLERLSRPMPNIKIGESLRSSWGSEIDVFYRPADHLLTVVNDRASNFYEPEDILRAGGGDIERGIRSIVDTHYHAPRERVGVGKRRLFPEAA